MPGSSHEQVASILALMRTGRASDAETACEQMLVAACEAYRTGSDFRDVAGAAGAVEAVVQVLRAHSRDPILHLQGCTALDNLCANHERNCVRAGAAGAIDTVLAVTQPTDASDFAPETVVVMTSRPIKALGHITVESAEHSAAAMAAGALPRVLAAMRAHLSSLEMQCVGCLCLRGLVMKSDVSRTSAVRAGAIEDVLKALSMHASDVELSQGACFALHELFFDADIDSDVHTRVHADAAMRAAIDTLHAHRVVADVQDAGCSLLYTLAGGSELVRTVAFTAGSVEAVMAALRAHPGSADVQYRGLHALGPLSQGNAPAVAAAGWVELVLTKMDAHVSVDKVQRGSCLALTAFLQNEVEMSAAQLARGVAAVVRALREHFASPQCLECGACALNAFVIQSAESLAIVHDAGAVDALAAALRMSERPGFLDEMEDKATFTFLACCSLTYLVSARSSLELRAMTAQDTAVRGGVLESIANTAQHLHEDAQVAEAQQMLLLFLDSAAQRHDGALCAQAATCARFAAARARGEMRALPSCGARTRAPKEDGGAAKTRLLRCARCLKAVYCSAAHQKKDWAARHKAECRKPQGAGDGASGSAET